VRSCAFCSIFDGVNAYILEVTMQYQFEDMTKSNYYNDQFQCNFVVVLWDLSW
jgi:hypothetical protein